MKECKGLCIPWHYKTVDDDDDEDNDDELSMVKVIVVEVMIMYNILLLSHLKVNQQQPKT